MRTLKKIAALLAFAAIPASLLGQTLKSPDGNLTMEFSLTQSVVPQ